MHQLIPFHRRYLFFALILLFSATGAVWLLSNSQAAGAGVAAAPAPNAPLAAGDLDTSFAPNVLPAGSVSALAVQTNGQILIGGDFTTVNGVARNRIARLNADGTLDATFGNALAGADGTVNALALQTDGKVLIGGGFSNVNGVERGGIARLNTNGTLDTTFGNGLAGADFDVFAIALQTDGKVLIGGGFTTVNDVDRGGIARLNTSGTLDTSFGNNLAGADFDVNSVALLQTDGKVVIGGAFNNVNDVARNGIARLNTSGTLDTSFGNNLTGTDDAVRTLALQTDGKVVIGGAFNNVNNVARNGIARLNTSGTLDTAFGDNLTGTDDAVRTLALQTDGKVVIGGAFNNVNDVERNRIARLNPTGTLDTTFGNNLAGTNNAVATLVRQADGRTLIGGDFTNVSGTARSGLARLLGDLAPPPPPPPPPPPTAAAYEDNTVLSVWGNFRVGNFDWMTSTNPFELGQANPYRQTFYAPMSIQPGTFSLYRLLRSNPFDHMDSGTPGEGGYSTEGSLGGLFTSQFPGTSSVNRWINGSGDHLTTFVGDGITSGYQNEGIMGYAFKRYPNSGVALKSVSGGEITLKANLVAGGAIWELFWNGKQFINDWDYGRQLQVAYYSRNAVTQTLDNPTEAGDSYGWPARRLVNGNLVERNPNLAHGSPLIYATTIGKTLRTSCWPLQWQPENHGGGGLLGGENQPSMSKMRFAKEVELDFQRHPHIIRWTSTVDFVRPSSEFAIELPTAYLNREFNTMSVYSGITDTETPVTPAPSQENGVFGIEKLAPGFGTSGIMSTSDGRYALGVYYANALQPQFNQSASGFAFYRFELGSFSNVEAEKKYNADATKISLILRTNQPIPAGTHTWTTYLLVGSLADVKRETRRLWSLGY